MSDEFKIIEGKEDVVNVLENRFNNLIPESMFKVEDLRILLLCKLIGINPNDWDEKDKYPDRKKYVLEGLDAKSYQEKDVKNAIQKVQNQNTGDEKK